jgi:hypothetical protein
MFKCIETIVRAYNAFQPGMACCLPEGHSSKTLGPRNRSPLTFLIQTSSSNNSYSFQVEIAFFTIKKNSVKMALFGKKVKKS